MNWLYTIVMLSSIVSCAWLLRRNQKKLDLHWSEKLGIGLGAFIGAMIGAKLPFALSDWEGLRSGLVWFSHGKTILFGIVGGYFGVEYTKWGLGITIKTGDTFAVPVALGVAIGRLGCFIGGCCYGKPTELPWGIVFDQAGPPPVPRHPTQLYEFAFHLLMVGILIVIQRRGIWPGQLLKFYLIVYLIYRFASELIRPEPTFWFGLTAYQYATLLLIPIFGYLWHRDAVRSTI
ncbi:MAG: prolipoprotein diacylglyceryl transferase [Pirellulaceae bacterium]|nr:prolipoprotein diacylglyceryl transferase [Pirellulaceae bacterium]